MEQRCFVRLNGDARGPHKRGILVWVAVQIYPYRVDYEQTCEGAGVGKSLCGSGTHKSKELRSEHGEALGWP